MSELGFLEINRSPDENDLATHRALMKGSYDVSFHLAFPHLQSRTYIVSVSEKSGPISASAEVTVCAELLYLESIWVETFVRNQGHGIRLYWEIEQFARDLNVKRFMLHTFGFQNALPFWKRVGFEIISEVPVHFSSSPRPEDYSVFYLAKNL